MASLGSELQYRPFDPMEAISNLSAVKVKGGRKFKSNRWQFDALSLVCGMP
jgi:hypothetical protein